MSKCVFQVLILVFLSFFIASGANSKPLIGEPLFTPLNDHKIQKDHKENKYWDKLFCPVDKNHYGPSLFTELNPMCEKKEVPFKNYFEFEDFKIDKPTVSSMR